MAIDVRPTIVVHRASADVARFMFDPANDVHWTGGITASLTQWNGSQRSFQASMWVPIAVWRSATEGEGAAADGLAGEDPEEHFYEVHPGSRCRGEVIDGVSPGSGWSPWAFIVRGRAWVDEDARTIRVACDDVTSWGLDHS